MANLTLPASGIRPAGIDHDALSGLNAGVALVGGEAVYLHSDGTFKKATAAADTAPAKVRGLVARDADLGRGVTVIKNGPMGPFSGLTPGANYYLSDTAGAISDAAGTVSIVIGFALDAETLWVNL